MNRLLIIITLLYSVTTAAVLTLPDKAEIGHSINYALNGGVERGLATLARYNDSLLVSISNSSPANFASSGYALTAGDAVVLSTTGTLPSGLTAGTVYYVLSTGSTFTVSLTRGGTAIATTSAGTGNHTLSPLTPHVTKGGTPSKLSLASSNVNPIQGQRSLVVSAGGTTAAAGEGFTLPLAVDVIDRGVTMNVSFSYIVQSGTFTVGSITGATIVDSDLEPFLWDATNNVSIPVTPSLLQCGGVGTKCDFVGQAYIPLSASSLRLGLHVSTVNTLAWSVKFDGFTVSRAVRNFGANVSDFRASGVNTITATTTAPTKGTTNADTIGFARVGDSSHVIGQYRQTAAGGNGSGDYLFSLPAGQAFDLNKISVYTGGAGVNAELGQIALGSASFSNSNTTVVGFVIPYDATRFRLYGNQGISGGGGGQLGFMGSSYFSLANATETAKFDFTAPIAGWSAGSSASDQSPSVPVNFSAYRSTSYTYPSTPANFVMDFLLQDTLGGVSLANSTYTFKSPGWYHCDYRTLGATTATTGQTYIQLLLDAVPICTGYMALNSTSGMPNICSKDFQANVNQVLNWKYGGPNVSGLGGLDIAYITCHKTNQGLGITAGDPVNSTYFMSTSTAITANQPMRFDTRDRDATGITSTTTGLTTIQQTGWYDMSVMGQVSSGQTFVSLKKNGTVNLGLVVLITSGFSSGTISRYLVQGDTVGFYPDVSVTFVGGSTPTTQMSIKRTGS